MDNNTVQHVTPPQKPRKKILFAGIIGLAILIALGIALLLMTQMQQKAQEDSQKAANATAHKLYDVLGNAAKQRNIRVGMYRATYANKADADAKKNIGTIVSSVGEVDNTSFRSVFVQNVVSTPKFAAGRCINGTEYIDNITEKKNRPETLSEGVALLGQLHQSSVPFLSPCPHVGVVDGSSPDLAVTRLSDGVMPVTLTDSQATNWVVKMKAANLFTVKDEGTIDYNGKQVRKISFTPKDETVNQSLYDTFMQVADIEKTLQEHPKAEWKYSFIAINPGNTGGVGGYYLIDESLNLPVYSELYGTNKDRDTQTQGQTAIRNLARTKQSYAYPKQPSIDLNTPLEFLE